MPSISTVELDSFDVDALRNKYSDRTLVTADKNCKGFKVLPSNYNPTLCDIHNGFHFFSSPTQPIITRCFCQKYHTYFSSQHLSLPPIPVTIPASTTEPSNSMEIDL